MKNDNRQNTPEYNAMADAAIAMLDTKFLKALSDPTRVRGYKSLKSLFSSGPVMYRQLPKVYHRTDL